ncbi:MULTISPECIES: Holliday junction branch migration protein RuvA [Trichocoleus]|uniref:Holliday junction branch migration complex subunit RuvA n=1 Tax=Trichocoleus desertorum GB2-A4 TaxID=2933944 RepID=A0ABV0J9V7_9CYAN|nr:MULTISPECIES: Holliday junction branch migration protein RuvA [unclassified Trichocoleus]MBD1862242.1 Holliday junction branch migration protein RuvA [Trichocoleus sp. FACHB-46]MBD2096850.1 Holliday junction branch migration protein RuvA [Trichocoleus sp. FACHB-591]
MIGYLKGTVASIQKNPSNRVTLTLDVNQVGYDIQVVPRLIQQLPDLGEPVQIFTHLQVREDQMILFGFGTAAERDLFRQLVSVSGIGPQLAVALLDKMGLQDLVQAIVSGNTKALARTPGVGAKTAERIALELKTKLAEWRQHTGLSSLPSAGPTPEIQEDVEMTLLALGYTSDEIMQALQAVGQNTSLAKNSEPDAWIREAIAWLSQ